MDYWPNIAAVVWFAQEVFPQLRQALPRAVFYVVGMNPAPAVQALAQPGKVVVTGKVPDVRPYLRHARAVVAPLRVARGIQNKVLEAMAMARPVIASRECAAGLSAAVGTEFLVATLAQEYLAHLVALLSSDDAEVMGRAARARVLADYSWEASLSPIDPLLAGVGGGATEMLHAHG
jgi:glycosyltransferase involved in cell wall biosynthesis